MFTRFFPVISPVIFALVVLVLGFITPGYDHINYTISRLAIEKYGWIQSLNFLQLALSLLVLGNLLSSDMKQSASRAAVRTLFILSAIFLSVAALAPTDPIENIPLRLSLYTPIGLVHAGSVILFLAVSPIGVHRLAKIFKTEPRYKPYSSVTAFIGYGTFILSIVWFLFFVMGIGLAYRGIFQKIIAVPVLCWFMIMGFAAIKNRKA